MPFSLPDLGTLSKKFDLAQQAVTFASLLTFYFLMLVAGVECEKELFWMGDCLRAVQDL